MADFGSIGHLHGEAGLREKEQSFESDVFAVNSVKIKTCLEKSVTKFYELPHVALVQEAVGGSAVCDLGIYWLSWLHSITFSIQLLEVVQQEQQNFL